MVSASSKTLHLKIAGPVITIRNTFYSSIPYEAICFTSNVVVFC